MLLEKGMDKLFKATNTLCRLLLLVIFVVMWVVVFGRYFLSKTPVWGEELVLLSLLWLGMLSGAEALRKDLHIKITVIDGKVSERFLKIQERIYDVIVTALCAVMLYHAVLATASSVGTHYMGLKISEAFAYAAMPVGYGLMLLIKLEKLYLTIAGRNRREGTV